MERGRPPMPEGRADWALFLDIDGTLLDLAPTPTEVVVPATLPALLDSLTGQLDGALALVSGRTLDTIDTLFPGGRDAAGSHGAEWRLGGQTGRTAIAGGAGLFDRVAGEAAGLAGILVERKGLAMALHFRNAPEQEKALRGIVRRALGADHPTLALLEGKGVLELVPRGSSKGEAIHRAMGQPPFAGRRPVFIGDDVTDESGFAAVNSLRGLSVHVGPAAATQARYRIPNPGAVRLWLMELDQHLGNGGQNAQP